MTQYPNSQEPWQMAPPPNNGTSHTNIATIALWILAALQGILFGCCSAGMGILTMIPYDELLQQPGWTEIDPQGLQIIYDIAGILAVCIFIFGCGPAIAYLILAFFVKKSSRPAIITCIVLLCIETLLLGGMLGFAILGAVVQGNVLGLFMSLFIFGSPVGLQLFALFHLFKALSNKQPPSPQETLDQVEPWEQ
ncbi:MAG: hypothetical protein JKX85_10320 [Phycisphaeraceae bacterium]|nr:hypothetical protein [Phycisphaeraceae bacterium]